MIKPEKLLYDLFLMLYRRGAIIFSRWNTKARKWITGQRQVKAQLKALSLKDKTIWVHCASLGEYEQGRPVIDRLKLDHPSYHLVLTFFSPSGYEIVSKKEQQATVLYLPFDSAKNARLFLDAVHPSLAVFIKYEHWYYYLVALRKRGIPALSVSAIFRPEQVFFKWYAGFFREILRQYDEILVQDEDSLKLLRGIGIDNVTVSGDTRFDRVLAIKKENSGLPVVERFSQGSRLVVAGSVWQADEELLVQYINEYGATLSDVKFLIAPHEIKRERIQQLVGRIKAPSVLYSEFVSETYQNYKVMIVDTMGVLSRCYGYATFAYIGGGFGAGIHNTLEAAVYGIPLIFGPKYEKFREAREMLTTGAAFSIADYKEFEKALEMLLNNKAVARNAGEMADQYVSNHAGATEIVMQKIKETMDVQTNRTS